MAIVLLLCLIGGAARVAPWIPAGIVVLGGIVDQVLLQPQRQAWWDKVGLQREVTIEVLAMALGFSLILAYAAYGLGRAGNSLYRKWATSREN